MNERFFLEQALEELEQALEELEYWKNKYKELEQTCIELVDWCKRNINTGGNENGKNKRCIQDCE